MSRSTKKGPYIDKKLVQKIAKAEAEGSRKAVKTWSRSAVIIPGFIGKRIAIHTGKDFKEILISESMVGHKLGEFAPTRSFRGHSKKGKIAKATGTTGSVG